MTIKKWTPVALLAAVIVVVGCAKPEDKGGQAKNQSKPSKGKHDDWWCAEHGIPEEECSKCSAKLEKEHKAMGDWCKEHDIAKSQCFACDPSPRDKYKLKYKAKYGADKEPPEPTDNMPKKDTKDTKDDKAKEK